MDEIRFADIRKQLLLFALIATGLVTLFFWKIPSNYFLFIHDESLHFPGPEIKHLFQVRNLLDLGTSETIQQFVNIFDRLYYVLAYGLGISLTAAHILIFWLKLFISLSLPFIGFKKINEKFNCFADPAAIVATSIWYAFNMYTLIYWHGNNFALTLMICYALGPLAFSYWESVFFDKKSTLKDLLLLALTLFLMSFALYFFAPFVLLLLGYTFLNSISNRKSYSKILLQFLKLAILCLPLFAMHFMVLYEMFFLSAAAQNTTGTETYGNIQGGLLYMFLNWFTWPIYIVWTPRNFWTFTDYYKNFLTFSAPLLLFFQIIWGYLKGVRSYKFIVLLLLTLIFIFLAKGPQEPFGEIYLFLIKYIPGFRVFRSPDSKFGFVIVFLIALLSLMISQKVGRNKFILVMLFVALAQCSPFFSGLGVHGENTKTSRDRVITVPDECQQLAKYLNDENRKFGYVMTFPAINFARYDLGKGEEHAGQDLLPKLIGFPFVYVTASTGMARLTVETLNEILVNKKYMQLRSFGIRYYIIRRDIFDTAPEGEILQFLKATYKEVLRNKFYILYEDEGAASFIQTNTEFDTDTSRYPLIEIESKNPIASISLKESYHASWNLYSRSERIPTNIFTQWFDSIWFLFRKPLNDYSHKATVINMNLWESSGAKENKLTLVYLPQSLFHLLTTISILIFLLYAVMILKFRKCKNA